MPARRLAIGRTSVSYVIVDNQTSDEQSANKKYTKRANTRLESELCSNDLKPRRCIL
jgi:hypothetical protein